MVGMTTNSRWEILPLETNPTQWDFANHNSVSLIYVGRLKRFQLHIESWLIIRVTANRFQVSTEARGTLIHLVSTTGDL
jgi:hypothetical protein